MIGARVRVLGGRRVPHLEGMVGTIERIYRSSGRTAVHVRLADGRWQLFWLEELELPGENPKLAGTGGS